MNTLMLTTIDIDTLINNMSAAPMLTITDANTLLNTNEEDLGRIQYLDLSNLNISCLADKSFRKLCEILTKCRNLQVLKLLFCNYPPHGTNLQMLFDALAQCNSLHTLNLEGNNLDNLTWPNNTRLIIFLEGLRKLKNLLSLNLSDTNLGEMFNPAADALAEDIRAQHTAKDNIVLLWEAVSQCTTLKCLYLKDNKLWLHPSAPAKIELLKMMFYPLQRCINLEVLDLSCSNFSDLSEECLEPVCNALKAFKDLKTFSIGASWRILQPRLFSQKAFSTLCDGIRNSTITEMPDLETAYNSEQQEILKDILEQNTANIQAYYEGLAAKVQEGISANFPADLTRLVTEYARPYAAKTAIPHQPVCDGLTEPPPKLKGSSKLS